MTLVGLLRVAQMGLQKIIGPPGFMLLTLLWSLLMSMLLMVT